MSQSHSHTPNAHAGHGHGGSGEMNLKKIIFVGVLALVVFAAGIVWAYFIMVGQVNEIRRNRPARVATEIGKPEIGIVDQILFSADNRLDVWKAERKQRLEGLGWIDKGRGIVHIPIDQAMAKVVASPPDIPGEGVPPAATPAMVPGPQEPKGADASKPAGDKR